MLISNLIPELDSGFRMKLIFRSIRSGFKTFKLRIRVRNAGDISQNPEENIKRNKCVHMRGSYSDY